MIEERRDKTSRTRVQVTCSAHAPRADQELSNSINSLFVALYEIT